MLNKDPAKRPTARQVLESPCLKAGGCLGLAAAAGASVADTHRCCLGGSSDGLAAAAKGLLLHSAWCCPCVRLLPSAASERLRDLQTKKPHRLGARAAAPKRPALPHPNSFRQCHGDRAKCHCRTLSLSSSPLRSPSASPVCRCPLSPTPSAFPLFAQVQRALQTWEL